MPRNNQSAHTSARFDWWPGHVQALRAPVTNRIGSGVLLLLSFILVSGCRTERGPEQSNTADLNYLRAVPEDWDRAFNANDAAKVAALYADETIYMPENAPTLRGRSAVQADFERYFAQFSARHETFVDEILTHQDWAIERGRFTTTFTPKPSGPQRKQSGRQVVCRRKVNGSWLIVWEIWNTDGPAAR